MKVKQPDGRVITNCGQCKFFETIQRMSFCGKLDVQLPGAVPIPEYCPLEKVHDDDI